MKSTIKMLIAITIIALSLCGCGGSGNSSSPQDLSSNIPTTTPNEEPTAPPNEEPTAPPNENKQPSPNNTLANILEINPLRDLGLEKSDLVCFRIRSYNNVTESILSTPTCRKIENELKLILSWNDVTGGVSGYYVYFGTNENNATNFLADVIES